MRVIRSVSGAGGFNLGMNQGAIAGAGIAAHLHQHVVPRWPGDQNFMPIIGRTKTLPELLSDTRALLAEAWTPEPASRRLRLERRQQRLERLLVRSDELGRVGASSSVANIASFIPTAGGRWVLRIADGSSARNASTVARELRRRRR